MRRTIAAAVMAGALALAAGCGNGDDNGSDNGNGNGSTDNGNGGTPAAAMSNEEFCDEYIDEVLTPLNDEVQTALNQADQAFETEDQAQMDEAIDRVTSDLDALAEAVSEVAAQIEDTTLQEQLQNLSDSYIDFGAAMQDVTLEQWQDEDADDVIAAAGAIAEANNAVMTSCE